MFLDRECVGLLFERPLCDDLECSVIINWFKYGQRNCNIEIELGL